MNILLTAILLIIAMSPLHANGVAQADYRVVPLPRVDGYLPVEKVYGFNPCPDSLDAELKAHIRGVQGNLWTEYISCPSVAEYYALPRMAALAEVQWCSSKKDFAAFRQRLDALTAIYRLHHLNYARHLWPEQIVKPWIDN